ncbi:MAG: hypothetical protein N2513_00665 [Deltaproteobacteria bacterium]|nr:hypothetical protein [Deltaproteobacteria bacterium]
MIIFALMDSAFFGRGVFGIFTSETLALEYAAKLENVFCQWEIKRLNLIGEEVDDDLVYVAYIYHELYDSFTLEGVYANGDDARDAVGHKGMVVQFKIDSPDKKKTIVNT